MRVTDSHKNRHKIPSDFPTTCGEAELGKRGPTCCQTANHSAKSLSDGRDGAAVGTVLCHAGISVQQSITRHPHMVEPELPIVYPIQTSLQQPSILAYVENRSARHSLAENALMHAMAPPRCPCCTACVDCRPCIEPEHFSGLLVMFSTDLFSLLAKRAFPG